MGRRFLYQAMVFLLLVMLTDLTLPQICCEELSCESGASAALSSANSGGKDALVSFPSDQRGQRSDTSNFESGCFCCCVDILLSCGQTSDFGGAARSPVALSARFLPISPPKDLFHPPRLV
jgi:hypothetical protein